MIGIKLAVTALLVLLNAFFVLAEFALVSVRPSRIEELLRQGRRRARLVKFALQRLDDYLAAVQLGITMTSLGIGWLGEPALALLLQVALPELPAPVATTLSYTASFAIAFGLITGLHILFGEQIPKLAGIKRPEQMAFLTIVPMTAVYYLSWLPLLVLNHAARLVLRLLGITPEASLKAHSNEEIRILLDRSEKAGKLSLDQLMMFENLFDFGNTTVRQVMTPRNRIAFLARSRPWAENLAVIRERHHSRYPVCDRDLDSVTGYVHVKDLYLAGDPAGGQAALDRPKAVLRFRPDETLADCLRRLQEERRNLGFVYDDAGRLLGLVTVEDLVEEIVGEIRDSHEGRPPLAPSAVLVAAAAQFDLIEPDRWSAIRTLAAAVHREYPSFDLGEALQLLDERERGLTSALGNGVAVPHARVPSLDRPLLAFARSRRGVEFDAPDGRPVRLVFLILTPESLPAAHLQILCQIARLLSNPTLKSRLLEAATLADLREVFSNFEARLPDGRASGAGGAAAGLCPPLTVITDPRQLAGLPPGTSAESAVAD